MKNIIFLSLIVALLTLSGCIKDPNEETNGGLCTGYSFSIIDKDEWEQNGNLVNLVGKDGHPYDPDDIVIVNELLDTMYMRTRSVNRTYDNETIVWWFISGFSYYDDLGCIGITERIDLRYFVQLDQEDTDTMDLVLKPSSKGRILQIYYNGIREQLPTHSDIPSSYWFLKEHP